MQSLMWQQQDLEPSERKDGEKASTGAETVLPFLVSRLVAGCDCEPALVHAQACQ